MFSDDREAQRYIEAFTDVKVLRLHEVITLGKMQGLFTLDQAMSLFDR